MKLLLLYKDRKRPVIVPDEGNIEENLQTAFQSAFQSNATVTFTVYSEEWQEYIDIDCEVIASGSKIMVTSVDASENDTQVPVESEMSLPDSNSLVKKEDLEKVSDLYSAWHACI